MTNQRFQLNRFMACTAVPITVDAIRKCVRTRYDRSVIEWPILATHSDRLIRPHVVFFVSKSNRSSVVDLWLVNQSLVVELYLLLSKPIHLNVHCF